MQHRCNAWCFEGPPGVMVHAMLFASEATDWAQKEVIARAICQQVGFEYVSALEATIPGIPTMGTPTAGGPARGRIVVFGKGNR